MSRIAWYVDSGAILVTGERSFRVAPWSAALRAAGAEVVVGDLLEPADVYRVVSGCRRVYFGMSVFAGYLEATVTMAAVAREVGVDALVNMSWNKEEKRA